MSAPTKDRTARPTRVLPEPLSRNARDLAPASDALTNRLPAQNPEADERSATAHGGAKIMPLTVGKARMRRYRNAVTGVTGAK